MENTDKKRVNKKDTFNDNSDEPKTSHELDEDKGKPDFTPENSKIVGPSHASSSYDKVEQGINMNEIEYNPLHRKF